MIHNYGLLKVPKVRTDFTVQGGENMPGRDGTGPNGKGPMTGRKLGPCNKDTKSEPIEFGQGFGCRRGLGRGFGYRQVQTEQNQKE